MKGAGDIAKVLIDNGANVALADNESIAPLHAVSRSGNKEIMKLLTDADADINAKNKYIKTPLICALQQSRTEATKYFLTGCRHNDQEQRRTRCNGLCDATSMPGSVCDSKDSSATRHCTRLPTTDKASGYPSAEIRCRRKCCRRFRRVSPYRGISALPLSQSAICHAGRSEVFSPEFFYRLYASVFDDPAIEHLHGLGRRYFQLAQDILRLNFDDGINARIYDGPSVVCRFS